MKLSGSKKKKATTDSWVSPKEFLRSRRPERFSDSTLANRPALDRLLLEYHLSKLTSRSEEALFERFAKRLAEHEICPNLQSHTGPTGGGDSKVDTETYPVASELSMGWYVGLPNAGSERWAFAISAKKEWRQKARSDLQKIDGVGRGYTKAYFVTNQYVKDRTRAELESQWSKEYGLDVHIMDLGWILDRVFHGKREGLAIEELRLAPALNPEVVRGPLDTVRERDLQVVEAHIQAALVDGRRGLALAGHCLEAALLARSLERSRTDVDGMFLRARRMAEECGTGHQLVLATYEHAWTTFWWFEDFGEFVKLYDMVQQRIGSTEKSYELELMMNLYNLLRTVRHQPGTQVAPELTNRRAWLRGEMQRLSEDSGRPTSALHARTLLLLMRLPEAGAKDRDKLFGELAQVVRDCEPMVGFSLEPLVDLIELFGDVAIDSEAFSALFELIVEVTTKREGDITAARMFLARGESLLRAERPYDAIRMVGRSLALLYKYETRSELMRALHLCGSAYEQAGLLWAARGSFLVGASVAAGEFQSHSEVTPSQALMYSRVKLVELRLGRLSHILAWHELDQIIRRILVDKGYDAERLFKDQINFDAVLGILLLRTDIWLLGRVGRLADALERIGLPLARVCLLYALGYEDEAATELGEESDKQGDLCELFEKWRNQPASRDLPAGARLDQETFITLESRVLGCHVVVRVENLRPCVATAESVLSALEAFLATGLRERVMALQPELRIEVSKARFSNSALQVMYDDSDGHLKVAVKTGFDDPDKLTAQEQTEAKECIADILIKVLAHCYYIGGGKSALVELLRDQRANDRAVNFTSSFVALGNALGSCAPIGIDSWCSEGRDRPLQRHEPWDIGLPAGPGESPECHLGAGIGRLSPSERLSIEKVRHDQLITSTPIRSHLWDRAEWRGTGYMTNPGREPGLLLIFKNGEAAEKIFAGLKADLGHRDDCDLLRIAIIRGIDKSNPLAYRVVVGPNSDSVAARTESLVTTIARHHKMIPETDNNIEGFLVAFGTWKKYWLYGGIDLGGGSVDVLWSSAIEKADIHVRNAWEIGENDSDVVGIVEDVDDPIIPDGIKDAPVLRTMEKLRKLKRTRRLDTPSAGRSEPKLKGKDRNRSCPCGSGRKFKKCHGK